MLDSNDIPGVDEDSALRVIAVALTIAPGLDALAEGSRERRTAVAILRGVATAALIRGPSTIKSQRIGPAAIEYLDASAFTADDRAALRALCGAGTADGGPIGRFPKSGTFAGIWPEQPNDD